MVIFICSLCAGPEGIAVGFGGALSTIKNYFFASLLRMQALLPISAS